MFALYNMCMYDPLLHTLTVKLLLPHATNRLFKLYLHSDCTVLAKGSGNTFDSLESWLMKPVKKIMRWIQ